MDLYEKAFKISDEIVSHRRHIHENAEAGDSLPRTVEYVGTVLEDIGIHAFPCGNGLIADIGKGEKTVLLRADMDALPMNEESGESFKSRTNAAHTCGHDLHCAMLLGGAKLLWEATNCLPGKVRLMFQPGEETLTGCNKMIGSGLLENDLPKAAFAVHVAAGRMPAGAFMYNSGGVMMLSADTFRITVNGIGGHSAYPHLTVDPLRIACRIYSFLESLAAKECDASGRTVVSVGKLNCGKAGNVIADRAILEGSLRSDSKNEREKLKRRILECSRTIAEMLGGSAEVSFSAGVPPLICDRDLTEKSVSYLKDLSIPWREQIPELRTSASDDFALIAERIPSSYIYLSAGFDDERGDFLAHDPRVRFDEKVCPIGAAVYAQLASRFLCDVQG